MVVQQIVDLAPIDLIHGHSHCKVPLIVLPIVNASFEEVLDGQVLEALHRVGLAGAGLSVGENCDGACVEYKVKNGFHTELV